MTKYVQGSLRDLPRNEQKHRGVALIMSMIFLVIFSALAVSMAAMSGTNTQIASNQHKIDCARACAESGFDVIRYWFKKVSIPGTTSQSAMLSQITNSLNSGITNVTVTCDSNSSTITIPDVTLDSANAGSFHATLKKLTADPNIFQIDVTGVYGSTTKTIRVNYNLDVQANTVFNYGVATKGPLSLSGNVGITGAISVDANVYIESLNSNLALSVTGSSEIAGEVSIVNPIAYVDLLGGNAIIGGETGQAAITNHVDFGVPASSFPILVTSPFESYVQNVINSSTDTTAKATYENVRIAANTNPKFTKQITLNGVIYIEAPNVVEFAGGVDITGVIVGCGSMEDNSGTNKLKFTGNVTSHPLSSLPAETKFAGIRSQTGTFIIAPGFNVSFGGNFTTLCGAIAGNGIEFSGNAGGTILGSVINYSDNQMTLCGNSDLYFNRSGTSEAPAGFVPQYILKYNQASYTEVIL
jgi:Tfp pilus assembly protein PilX